MSSPTSATARASPCRGCCGCSTGVKLRTTFFVPGWVAETWPDVARSVRDAGHEIGHHGYLHESVRGKDEATEEGYLLRGLEALDTRPRHPAGRLSSRRRGT